RDSDPRCFGRSGPSGHLPHAVDPRAAPSLHDEPAPLVVRPPLFLDRHTHRALPALGFESLSLARKRDEHARPSPLGNHVGVVVPPAIPAVARGDESDRLALLNGDDPRHAGGAVDWTLQFLEHSAITEERPQERPKLGVAVLEHPQKIPHLALRFFMIFRYRSYASDFVGLKLKPLHQ